MTLKERFKEIIFNYDYIPNTMTRTSEQCEQISDEFAIEFADWIRACKLKGRPYDFDNIKELLKIYKKEEEL